MGNFVFFLEKLHFKFTLNLSGPIGGFAYGIPVNARIGLPLCDLMYLPINLLSFDKVTRNSFEIILETTMNMLQKSTKITFSRNTNTIFEGKKLDMLTLRSFSWN